ncbi:MAG TPA: hypothetical protein VI456_13475 [Polyangia bacterium]
MQKATPSTSLRLLILGGAVAGALATLPRVARAEELAPPTAAASAPASGGSASGATPASAFGADGAWVLSVQSYASGSSTNSFFLQKVSGEATTVEIKPAIDYFIGGGVSVGGVVGVIHSSSTTVDFGVRAGFNQRIVSKISFWPTAGAYGSFRDSSGNTSTTAAAVVYAPFLFHPVEHFFLGAGPFLGYQFHGGDFTEYGLDFVIGGWL